MIIVLTPNEKGNIELTKEDLEKLLNQAEEEGARKEREKYKINITPGTQWRYFDNTPMCINENMTKTISQNFEGPYTLSQTAPQIKS